MRRLSFSLLGLRAQVLLWIVLPVTLLMIIFSLSGVQSHQNSMREMALEEKSRLVTALAYAISLERELYAMRNTLPVQQVPIDALNLAELLVIEHSHAITTFVLLNADGQILFSRGEIPSHAEMMEWVGIPEALNGDSGVVFTTDTMHGDVIAYTPVPGTDWSLIIREPWHSITDPLIRFEQVMPFILLTAIVVSLLILFFGLRYVVQPLHRLGTQASLIGQGKFEAARQPVGGVMEIEDLRLTLDLMAGRIQDHQAALKDYLRIVTQTQEEERSRIARELHDETVQTLIALSHKAQMVKRTFDRNPATTGEKLGELRTMIDAAIEEVRRFSRALRPAYLEDLGLITALEIVAQQADVLLEIKGTPYRLKPETELALYRIAQEAISNARRHAQAKQIRLIIEFTPSAATLCVEDDGIGFESPQGFKPLTHTGHFGLMGMRERAQLIDAELSLQTAPGQGTRVKVVVTNEKGNV